MNKSIRQKIQQLEGLLGTKEISQWEETFISDMVKKIKLDDRTSKLSSKQVDIIDRIHGKHFV